MTDIDKLYNLIVQVSTNTFVHRTSLAGWLLAIGLFLIVITVARAMTARSATTMAVVLLVASVVGWLGYNFRADDMYKRADVLAHSLANDAIDKGVKRAQKAHATQLQYIHAIVTSYGDDVQQCRSVKVHHNSSGGEAAPDWCASNTPYVTSYRVDQWTESVEHCSTDSKGNETCTTEYIDHFNVQYDVWFDQVDRYWTVSDTSAKYLFEGVYHQLCQNDAGAAEDCARDKDTGKITDDRKPVVYLTGWVPPENAAQHIVSTPGAYQDTPPEFWVRVRDHASNHGEPVLATYVGDYFNWVSASEAVESQVFTGHYNQMKTLVQFPGPTGVSLNYKDAYGKDAVMRTDLSAVDSGMALDFKAVISLGLENLPVNVLAQLNDGALLFQGPTGPAKQASIRWFVVNSDIVQKMGGIINTTQALTAYLNDETVWGKFSLPKNLIIEVASVDPRRRCIDQRDMATGMLMGNTIVMQEVRLSIAQGECLPLTVDNMIGSFAGKYMSAENNLALTYYFAPAFKDAGQVAGLIYAETPGYKEPDPHSTECETAAPEHRGFLRYRMCTQSWRQTNIPLDENDYQFLSDAAETAAEAASPLTMGVVFLVLGILAVIGEGANELGVFENM